MNRILIMGMSEDYGGIESYVMNLYRNIDRTKIQLDFIDVTDNGMAYSNEIKDLGGNIYKTCGRTKDIINHYISFFKFFKNYKYKCIYLNSPNLINIDLLIFATIFKVPIRIIHSHNSNDIKVKNKKLKNIFHILHKKYIRIFANNFFACSNIAGKYMFDDIKFKIIPNAIDIHKFLYN